MILVTSPAGGTPHGEPEHPSLALSEPVLRAVGHASPGTVRGVDEGPNAAASPLAADLDLAREEEAAARASLADAGTALEEARDVRDTALTWAEEAQDELMHARIRLGDLIAAEEDRVAALRGAAGRVERERRGSKAHRSAFIRWQMIAVSERAAHLRRTVAEQVGTKRFAQLQVAEAELAEAQIALGKAESAHRRATRAAESAYARVTQLEAETFAALDPSTAPSRTLVDSSAEVPAPAPTAERGRP
jgi:hypothetical protein